jgi:hypothetical protein
METGRRRKNAETAKTKLTIVVKYRTHGQEPKDVKLAPMIRPRTRMLSCYSSLP